MEPLEDVGVWATDVEVLEVRQGKGEDFQHLYCIKIIEGNQGHISPMASVGTASALA